MIITTIFKMSFLEAFVQKRKYNIYTLNFREVKKPCYVGPKPKASPGKKGI